MSAAKPKWSRKLNKKELRHLAETSGTGRPSLRELKANLEESAKIGAQCFECQSIARKVGIVEESQS